MTDQLKVILKNDYCDFKSALQHRAWQLLQDINHKILGGVLYYPLPRLEVACRSLSEGFEKSLSEKKLLSLAKRVLMEIDHASGSSNS